MADAGFTHAAGADIPHSATSRRGMLPALAGLAVGLAYAAIIVYWAVGGRWLLNTVGISLSQPGQAGHLAALLAVWGAAAVKAVAAVLPLLAIGVWPRTANGGLRRLARVLTWIEAAILVGYGLVLTASGLLVQAGVIEAVAHADRLALKWHAYLWDPWFLIWGIFVFLALWRSRPASQDHLPGRAPGAVQGATDRARRPRSWVYRDAGDLRELWGYFLVLGRLPAYSAFMVRPPSASTSPRRKRPGPLPKPIAPFGLTWSAPHMGVVAAQSPLTGQLISWTACRLAGKPASNPANATGGRVSQVRT